MLTPLFACTPGAEEPVSEVSAALVSTSSGGGESRLIAGAAATRGKPSAPTPRTFVPTGSTPTTAPMPFGRGQMPLVPAPEPSGASPQPQVTTASAIPGAKACTRDGAPFSMSNGGTPAIQHPIVHLIYWGSWPTHPYDAWMSIFNQPAFYNRMREYGVSTGSAAANTLSLPSGATGALTEEQLKAGVQSVMGQASSSDIFMVLLPLNTTSLSDTQNGFLGHHSSINVNGKIIPWGVSIYQFEADTETTVTHEVMEAITDPNATSSCTNGQCRNPVGTGWTPEIGDGCTYPPTKIAGLTAQMFWSQSACRCVGHEDLNNVDVLANGRFDYTIYRSGDNTWRAQGFGTNWPFGVSSDSMFSGDFNGDGRAEFAAFVPGSTGVISVLNIVAGTYAGTNIGTSGDIPVPGDYDGDGMTDKAVWDPPTGNWLVIFSSTGVLHTQQWGLPSDIPVAEDYDGDGRTDYAVLRPSTHTWWVQPSSGNQYFGVTWDVTTGDKPMAGDFNGDGVADWAYWRPSDGVWHVSYANTSTAYTYQWGIPNTDVPVARDVDGDWITDISVWRPSTGEWLTTASSNWGLIRVQWGLSTDVPIVK